MSAVTTALIDMLGTDHVGGLRIGELNAEGLADRFGTPLYVFDATVLRRTFAGVRDALGPRVEVLFALKANPNAAVAQTLRLAGAGCEVASAGELLIAERAGFDGPQIQFAGPGKHGRDLELALERRLGAINLESLSEYEAIRDLARARGVRPNVAIRINPASALGGSRMQMGGGSKRFGVDTEQVVPLVNQIRAEGVCELRGLHVYAGTQSFDAEAWLENARGLIAFASAVEAETGASITTLNFGGGFAVGLFDSDPVFDLARVGHGLRGLIDSDARPERRYFVEPGRFLVAAAGVYLTRVLYRKRSRERHHLVVDGGMHHHAAAAGVGSVIRRPYPIVLCRAVRAPHDESVTIGGPLCTPADELASSVALPEAHARDVLAVLASGAYGLTFSNVMFLSHPAPAEVLVDQGRAWLVRAPGRAEDFLRGQMLPGHEEAL